jgi:hypothetical protein
LRIQPAGNCPRYTQEIFPFVVHVTVLNSEPQPTPSAHHVKLYANQRRHRCITCTGCIRWGDRLIEFGALTGRLSCVPRKPTRQIASWEPIRLTHSTPVPEHAPPRCRPFMPLPDLLRFASVSGTGVQCLIPLRRPRRASQ